MNILVIGSNAWNDRNSFGNTVSNFFSGWSEDEFYNIYTRAEQPDNSVCNEYYRITDTSIVRNFFRKEKIGGKVVAGKTSAAADKGVANEKKFIHFLHKRNIRIFRKLEDKLWATGRWYNKKLEEFISKANPQIIFLFAIASGANYFLFNTLKKKTNAKTVLFVADDVYGHYSRKDTKRARALRVRFEQMMRDADLVYGASEQMCSEYEKLFDRKVFPLYKGCDFSAPTEKKRNDPIKMIYAGNLLFGRADTLAQLADTLEKVNANGVKVSLDIYSNTELDNELMDKLNVGGSSRLCGSRPYTEIKELMQKADIVLHVESFLPDEIKKVRYSFSTKIIDCLQSGSTFMVIGPKGIASVEYPRKINGAIVVDDTESLESVLREILNDDLTARADKIRAFAEEHHSIESVKNALRGDMLKLLNGVNLR